MIATRQQVFINPTDGKKFLPNKKQKDKRKTMKEERDGER
jgi:hypothetical protein